MRAQGLATFVGTLDDPTVGMGLAIAIGIHNVPEGLCVSIPIYYATKNRWQAFKWAFISGISEPIGAALGWVALANCMSDSAYAVIFGLVSGMMVNICIHELLPTAVKYDPQVRTGMSLASPAAPSPTPTPTPPPHPPLNRPITRTR